MEDELKITRPSPITRHIILYTIDCYKRSAFVVDDIDTIISILSNSHKGTTAIADLFQAVVYAFNFLAGFEPKEKIKFYEEIFAEWQNGNVEGEVILEYLFDFIATVELDERDDGIIIDLGYPDFTILPIKEYDDA